MDLGIEGKVAMVTGATRGIGLAIARVLAAEGVRVAIVARTVADVERVAGELSGLGVAADLTGAEGCERAFQTTVRALGPIEILINNVGTRAGTTWRDTGVLEVEAAMAGNLNPAVRLIKASLPGMVERGWGRVVVISSLYGREAGGAPAYNLAKAAEISMVTSMAREFAAGGVTVNAVAPGSILFESGSWHRRQLADPEGIAEFVRRELPRGSFGTPEEVAAVVAFLCSAQAGLVNGACVAVDGAQSRSNI